MSQNSKRNIAKKVRFVDFLHQEIHVCCQTGCLPRGWEAGCNRVDSQGPGPCHLHEASRADPELTDKFEQQLRLPSGLVVMRQTRCQIGNSVHRLESSPVECMVELGAGTLLGLQ